MLVVRDESRRRREARRRGEGRRRRAGEVAGGWRGGRRVVGKSARDGLGIF